MEGALETKKTQFYGAGKKCAIPAVRFYQAFYSSCGVMVDSRQVTLTNLIAGPLGTMPVALQYGKCTGQNITRLRKVRFAAE
jgi:hypothetical protein